MGHYAKVDQGKVVDVIVAEAEFFEDFVDTTPGEWIKCSYNTRGGMYYNPDSDTPSSDQSKMLRYNFPAVGFNYDLAADAFYPPKPFDSWTLNTSTYLWEPPVSYPSDDLGGNYYWSEENGSWESRTGS